MHFTVGTEQVTQYMQTSYKVVDANTDKLFVSIENFMLINMSVNSLFKTHQCITSLV